MSRLGFFHTACALIALSSGAAALVRRKGDRAHRRLGWVYAASMSAMNLSALLIYRLTGGFGPFHVAALVSLGTLAAGLAAVVWWRPRENWVERHYYLMSYSYVGLLAAAASEAVTRLPGAVFWWAVVFASAAVFAAGALVVTQRARRTLAPFRR